MIAQPPIGEIFIQHHREQAERLAKKRAESAANFEQQYGKTASGTGFSKKSNPAPSGPLPDLAADFANPRAISLSLMASATRVIEDTGLWEPQQALNWEIKTQWQTRQPHNFVGLLGFFNEDGTLFQAKPYHPRLNDKDCAIKYETAKGAGSRAFLPEIDEATRRKISEVQGVAVPVDGSFWDWVVQNPRLTIIFTEGPGKSLALLSAGYIAIALTGVNGGYSSKGGDIEGGLQTKFVNRTLIDDVRRFCGPDRKFVFAFDADAKFATVEKVNQAQRRLGKLLAVSDEGTSLSVATWNGRNGAVKGVDDLIAADGVAAWERALSDAQEFKLWQMRSFPPAPFVDSSCDEKGNSKSKLKPPSKIVEILAESWGGVLAYNLQTGSFWQYGADFDGLWSERPKELIRQRIGQALDKGSGGLGYGDVVTTIYTLLVDKLAVAKWREKTDVTPMRNGVLDNASMELMEHSPAHRLTWQLPYDYNPLATCQPIQEWMLFAQGGDEQRVQLLRAYLKAVVTGRSDLQRFVELIGPGGSGKSTYANLAWALVGAENCHATSLEALQTDKFETAAIFGKRLIMLTDAERYAGGVGRFKSITGGDPIPYERKYGQKGLSFTFGGMVILVANEAITSADYTSGMGRRRLPVPFIQQVADADKRKLIEFKNGEAAGDFIPHLPGLLNWVMAMPDSEVDSLIGNTSVSVPSLNASKTEVLLKTNSIAEWFDVKCVWSPGIRTQVGSAQKVRHSEGSDGSSTSWDQYRNADTWLYPSYRAYCDRSNIKPIALQRFGDLLKDLIQSQLKRSDVTKSEKGSRDGSYFTGISLRGDLDDLLPCPISGGADDEIQPPPPTPPDPEPETVVKPTPQALPTGDWNDPTLPIETARTLARAAVNGEAELVWAGVSPELRQRTWAYMQTVPWATGALNQISEVAA